MIHYPTFEELLDINPNYGCRDLVTIEDLNFYREWSGHHLVTHGSTTSIVFLDKHNQSCGRRDKRMCLAERKFLNPTPQRANYFAHLLQQKPHSESQRQKARKRVLKELEEKYPGGGIYLPITYEGYDFPIICVDTNHALLSAIKAEKAIWIEEAWPRLLQKLVPITEKRPMMEEDRQRLRIKSGDVFYIDRDVRNKYYPLLWDYVVNKNRGRAVDFENVWEYVLDSQSVKEEVFQPKVVFVHKPTSVPTNESYEAQFREIAPLLQSKFPKAEIFYLPDGVATKQGYEPGKFSSIELTQLKILEKLGHLTTKYRVFV